MNGISGYMKKGIAVLLIVSMCLLTGCSGKDKDSQAGNDNINTGADITGIETNQNSEVYSNSVNNGSLMTDSVDYTIESVNYEAADYLTEEQNADCTIVLNGTSAQIDGSGAEFKNNQLSITQAGTYVVSGTLTAGQIFVKAGVNADVHLILNGVTIQSLENAAIYIKKTSKVVLTLADGTVNTLTDVENYVYEDSVEEEPSAALFSKCDLTINGSGTLVINAKFNDGITVKDTLNILSGIFLINAADDGIIGRDILSVSGGDFTITAGGDGFKTTNDTDTTLGFILLEDGIFKIESENDGIQAQTELKISGGTFDITTGGGSGNAPAQSDDKGFGMWQQQTTDSTADSSSAKGLKAGTMILTTGGTFTLDTYDDSIHSNAAATIHDGTFILTSGDDGIHADSDLTINGGKITITKSYEGIEASIITVNGGEIDVTASDDGFNAAGGNDGSSIGGRWGQNSFSSDSSTGIVINGGSIYVNASGDGIDSNNTINMSGGTVIVNGPTNNGNGALDYENTFTQTGGTLIAAGSTGMAQAVSEVSNQACISMTFTSLQQAGTEINVKDASGNTVISFTSEKTFQNIVISSPDIQSDNKYTIAKGNSDIVSFTTSGQITYVYESGVTTGGQIGGFGGQGGGKEGGRGGK